MSPQTSHFLFTLSLVILSFHLIAAPFSKVEESFFMQACHDVLFARWGWGDGLQKSDFDHFSFPGVVPRSFIGPLLLVGPAKVFGFILDWTIRNVVVLRHSNIDYMPIVIPDTTTKLSYQFGTRFTLAIYCAASLTFVACSFQKLLKSNTTAHGINPKSNPSVYFILLCTSQFHLMFWGSRTIANSFALVTFQLALGCLFKALHHSSSSKNNDTKSDPKTALFYVDLMIFCLTFTCAVFRAEVFPLSLVLIIFTHFQVPGAVLSRIVFVGSVSSLVSIILTVGIDSFFWQRLLWPELEVFLFNGVEGKSVEWGTSPFHYYFTNLLPRIVPLAFVLAIISLFLDLTRFLFSLVATPTVRQTPKNASSKPRATISSITSPPRITIGNLLFFAFFHVAILSFIPHKEWRFIIYSIPLLNLAGALILCKAEENGMILARILIPLSLLATFCASLFMMYVSHYNYPGGVAFYRFHDHELPLNPVPSKPVVYIDVHVAMTGASRFGQSPCCIYDKNESISTRQEFMQFDWAIVGGNVSTDLFPKQDWSRIHSVYGYDGLERREPLSWIRETLQLLQSATFSMLRMPIDVRLGEKAVILKKDKRHYD